MKICDLQNRSLDSCVLRHVYTFNLLEEKGIFERIQDGGLGRVCVIGDGQSNFVSMALVDSRFAKLISINLTETLLSDLDLVEKLPLKDGVVQLASSKKELEILLKDTSTKLILLRANDVEYLKNSQIDLFVNIASFQEMKKATINDYFEVAKNNKSYLYCCNREAKVLYGGEVIEFRNYPWGEYKEQILSEECPWHRYFYSLRSAKLFKRLEYDGRILHRLVKY
jgi:hypothetical protein